MMTNRGQDNNNDYNNDYDQGMMNYDDIEAMSQARRSDEAAARRQFRQQRDRLLSAVNRNNRSRNDTIALERARHAPAEKLAASLLLASVGTSLMASPRSQTGQLLTQTQNAKAIITQMIQTQQPATCSDAFVGSVVMNLANRGCSLSAPAIRQLITEAWTEFHEPQAGPSRGNQQQRQTGQDTMQVDRP